MSENLTNMSLIQISKTLSKLNNLTKITLNFEEFDICSNDIVPKINLFIKV